MTASPSKCPGTFKNQHIKFISLHHLLSHILNKHELNSIFERCCGISNIW